MFKERAIAQIYKEFNQLDKGAIPNKPAVLPQDPTKLTRTEKRETLETVNLIKENTQRQSRVVCVKIRANSGVS